MSSRVKVVGLLATTALAAALVFVSLFMMTGSDTPLPGFSASNERLLGGGPFPEGAVATIEIATPTGSSRLEKVEGNWRVTSKDGFPANEERIGALVARMESARILYERPVDQVQLSQYGLNPVTEPSSSAVRVSLRDDRGESLIDLRVGNQLSLPGGSETETLVALPEEFRVVVIDEPLGSDWTAEAWLKPVELLSSGERVSELLIGNDPSGPVQSFRKNADGTWVGRTQSGQESASENQSILKSAVASLTSLPVMDVARAETPVGEIEQRRTMALETDVGLRIDYRIFRTSGADWLSVEAGAGRCDTDEKICERLMEKLDMLDGWLIQIPITAGSDLDLAYVVRD